MSTAPAPGSAPIEPYTPDLPKIAVIVGTEVAEVMAVSEKTKAALLSSPVFIDLGFNVERIADGDTYDPATGKFTKLEEILQQQADAAAAAAAAETTPTATPTATA